MKRTACVAAWVAMWIGPTAAEAVTNIRYERWQTFTRNLGHDTVAPIDTTASLSFSFDATATAADVASGFRFALAEKDAATRNVLKQFTLEPCNELPPVGADVLISITCRLYCDAGGKLYAGDYVQWSVTWCDVPVQGVCMDIGNPATLPSSSEPEDFELILLDENGQDGSFSTPEDGLSCSDSAPSGPELAVEAPEFAASGSIGVYSDPSGHFCSDQVTPLVPFRWYVVARLEGMTRCGIAVVELGIHGLPPGFFINVTPNPAAFAEIGNPFTTGGLGFNCERGDGEVIVLYTLDGISTNAVQNAELVVDAGNPPTNRFWPYPWNDLCPFPVGNRRRMRGTTFVINPPPGHPCDTTVHAEPATWGAVKGLYRGER